MPSCSRLSRSGLEALRQTAPLACRPSLTAARHDGVGNVQAGTERCSRPNQKITPKRRTECGQTRYPDPKTSPVHETGASPSPQLGLALRSAHFFCFVFHTTSSIAAHARPRTRAAHYPPRLHRCWHRPRMVAEVAGSSPEVTEAVEGKLGVANRVLNILVPEIVLQRSGVVAIIGELEAASVPQHVGMHAKGISAALPSLPRS
jgi:hypothetical protein